jgi:hypothetical protein
LLKDGVDLSTAAGRMLAHVLASVAEFELEVRRERTHAGQAAARAKGKRWGGSKKGRALKHRARGNHAGIVRRMSSSDVQSGHLPRTAGRAKLGHMHDESPNHPILDRAHEFDIVRFDLHHDPDDYRNDFLDLTMRRGQEHRRLRFLRPQDFRIERGFPASTRGMVILDVRHRQMEGIGVQVADFESATGGVTFYAADVVDLDAIGHAE